jgi:AcrR family transcriptional regulator
MSDLVPATRERILEGALLAMGRVGLRRFTMNDVSERSGLSRGTVYRYFPTKEDLLAVLAEYEQDRFSSGLRDALTHVPDDELQLERVGEYILNYLRQHPALTDLIEIEPAFVLGYLRRQLPVFHRITEELLGAVMRKTAPVQTGLITVQELNDLLLRVVLSVFLVPGEDSAGMSVVLEGALTSLLRLAAGVGTASRNGSGGAKPARRRTRQV